MSYRPAYAPSDEGALVLLEMPGEEVGLTEVRVSDIFENHAPGSGDWSWNDEFLYVMSDRRTSAILARVMSEGIGFSDRTAPVMLGSDGRVWDGHHRVCIARLLGIGYIMCDVVEEG